MIVIFKNSTSPITYYFENKQEKLLHNWYKTKCLGCPSYCCEKV